MADKPTLTATLTPDERSDLERCEKVIRRGRKAFLQVSAALMEIRDKQLYREHFSTFEKYCRKRWGFGARHGQRLLAAHEVVNNLRPIGRIPDNESQARPLVGLPPETQREVWQEVVETAVDGKVTAKRVAEIAEPHTSLPPEPAPAALPDWAALLQPLSFYLTHTQDRVVYSTPYDNIHVARREGAKGMVPQRGAYIISQDAFKDFRFVEPPAPADQPSAPRHDPRQVSNAGSWTPGDTAYLNRAQAVVNHAHPGKMPHVGPSADSGELERLRTLVGELEADNAAIKAAFNSYRAEATAKNERLVAENEQLHAENTRLKAEVVNLRQMAQLPDVKGNSIERTH